MGVNYHPPLTAKEAQTKLGVSKKPFEKLVADKLITVKNLGGTADFYVDHISLGKYIENYGGKKERYREFLEELINTEKKKKLVKWKWVVERINERKKNLEKSHVNPLDKGGISSFTVRDLTHDEILHYNALIKEDNARIKEEKKALLIAKLTGEPYKNTTKKKLDLSGAKIFEYSQTKEFVQKAKKKYKI